MARGRDVHGYTFTLSAPGTRAGASWPLRELAEHLGHSSWNPGKWCSMGAYRRCQICAAPSAVARGASCGIAIPDAAGDGPCTPLCFPGSVGCLALLGECTGALFVECLCVHSHLSMGRKRESSAKTTSIAHPVMVPSPHATDIRYANANQYGESVVHPDPRVRDISTSERVPKLVRVRAHASE